MRLSEISTQEQLNELDVRGSISSLADPMRATWNYLKSYTPSSDSGDAEAQAMDQAFAAELPNDGERAYYKDKSYFFDAKSKDWYETETESPAGLIAQRALMMQYGFTASGRPTIALRKKIMKKKRREERGVEADKKFTPAAAAKIVNAFQQSMNEYRNTGDLSRYLNNAEFLAQYISQGYDLKLLKKDVAGFFGAGVSSVPHDTTLLANIYNDLFVKPDAKKIAQHKSAYSSGGPRSGPSTRVLATDKDAAIKSAIVSTISTFDKNDAADFPKHLESIKNAGYDITDYTNLIQSEATKLVRGSQTYNQIGDMTAFLDTMTALKPVLPPMSATFGRKINSLNFKAMFPGISARDLAVLRQKRTALMAP